MKRAVTLAIRLLFFFLSAVSQPATGELAAIQDDWHYRSFENGAGFSVMLSPDEPGKDTLFFQTSGQNVRISVGNQLIYAQEQQEERLLTSYGRRWHLVKLPKITQPKQLQVELWGERSFDWGCFSEFSLDTAKVQAGKVFLYDLPYVLSLPGALLLTLIILMYYFQQAAWKQLDISLLGLLLLMSVLSISLSHTVQLFFDWPAWWWLISQVVIYLLPVMGNFVLYQIVEPEFKRKICPVIGIYAILALSAFVLELFGWPGFSYGLYLYYLLIVPCQFYVLGCLLLSARKYQNHYSRYAMVPMLSFCLVGALDGVNQFLPLMPWKTYLVPVCVYFLAAFVVCMLREQLLRERKMQEHANKLEYEIALAIEKSELDTLTGCRNRTAFDRFMQQRHEEKFSMIMLDIDYFKEVNDRLGHDSGDKVLRKFSLLVREKLDKNHCFFRWGGEEFVVYCPDDEEAAVLALAENIRQSVEQAEILPERQITVSIGVAHWHGDADSDIDLFRRMDDALYRAKHEGRNCVMQE